MRAALALIGIVAASMLAPARAQSVASPQAEPADSGLRETVVVRAAEPAPEDVAAFATVIDGAALPGRALDTSDILRAVPSAHVTSYGGMGHYATIALRGSTAEQVVVLVDGVPLNRALGGPVDLSAIPASRIDAITVYRGFPSAAAGLSGLGGLIDVRTRAARAGEEHARIDLLAGSLDTARASLGWSLGITSRVRAHVGAEYLEATNDFRFLDPLGTFETPGDDDDGVRRRNNDVRSRALDLSLAVDRIAGGDLSLRVRALDRERGVPGLEYDQALRARLDEEDLQAHAAWTWRKRDDGARGVDVLLDAGRNVARFDDPEGEIGIGTQAEITTLESAGASTLWRSRIAAHALLVRADLRVERARVENRVLALADRGGARRRLGSLVAEDVWTRGRFTLAPAWRAEWRRDDFLAGEDGVVPPPASDVRTEEFAWKLGAAWTLSEAWTLRGSAGRFHRAPSLLELFGDRGAVQGNPALVSESGDKVEIGLARRTLPWGQVRAGGELAFFATDASDLIVFVLNSQNVAVPRNLADATIRGVEASIEIEGWRGLALRASGSLQRARDASGGPSDGAPLVGRPERTGALALSWQRGRWEAGYEVTYVGVNASDSRDTPEARVPSRAFHDVRARCRLGGGLSFGVEVRNVFDQRTLDVLRFPLPGRLAFVSLGWEGDL